MVWDDVDSSVFANSPDLYRLFKFGNNRSTDKIILSSKEIGENSKKYVEEAALTACHNQSMVITKVNETILKFALQMPASKQKDEILGIAAMNISQAITLDPVAHEEFTRESSKSHEWN
jgi:hypothetical protein